MKQRVSKIALLIAIGSLMITEAKSAPQRQTALANFQMVNGVIYDVYAPGSQWRLIHAEATGLHTNGTIIRLVGLQEVRSRESKSVRAKVYGTGAPSGAIIGSRKVYGATVFLIGHKLLVGQEAPQRMALPIGQANINGTMMEVWKTGTEATLEQVRQWQIKKQVTP